MTNTQTNTPHQQTLSLAISHTPMHAYQWLVVVLAVVLNMLDGFDVLAIAFTAKSIQSELGLSGAQIGTLMSAGFIGMAIGSVGLAPLADKFGRRPLLMLATLLSAVGMLGTYFAASFEAIGFWRVVTGLGVGGILPCTNVIVSEYANQKWRGLAIAIYACGFGVGATLGGVSAVMLQDEFGFRSVFLTGAVLTALALVALAAWLPESVAFLEQKQPANALARLTQIAQKIGKTGDWQLPTAKQTVKKAPIAQLFAPAQIRTTLLIWLAFIAVMSSFYFISSWTPALLETSGLAKERSQTLGMAISLGGTVGSLIFGVLVSHFSAKSVLMAFVALSSLAIIGFVASPTLAIALVMAVLVGSLVNGCITGLYTINPTLYRTEFRSTGVGTAIGVGRISSIISPILAGQLLDLGFGKDDLYLGASGFILLALIALYFLRTPNAQKTHA
ncbi:MFS transporter [Moraxella caviae]|uniref:4-hydroxybenzoate transporter PcaK n=1 Tax=Moraxella caviae TaxID=34060 RepID=A0A1T0AAT2_9GAMM|nr:MFS transporter [Moraxella caviae]OOR92790.1 MFS transporter [Moraxella caviae]STZ14174.1 4-hydroxybenzoate transporter PcaK [Moraxella caviae]VEW12620.1 4-hydroxybenzoate transporter PcaK [Moraxella caviae]